jgi:hypothetical protein
MALPSHLRVVHPLSQERSEHEATTFLAALKARTDGRPPFLTSDQLPASIAALLATDSTPAPPPRRRGPGRPRHHPTRGLDPTWRYAQSDKQRAGGRIVAVQRRIVFGATEVITELVDDQHINTSYVARDNLTSRPSNSRLVRKALSHSKKDSYWQRHLDLEDAMFNFVRPHQALHVPLARPLHSRQWQQRTPAMAAGLTDHLWTLETPYAPDGARRRRGTRALVSGMCLSYRMLRSLQR